MKQVQISRKTLRHGGRGEPEPEVLPTVPASDTRAASAVLDRIDAVLDAA